MIDQEDKRRRIAHNGETDNACNIVTYSGAIYTLHSANHITF